MLGRKSGVSINLGITCLISMMGANALSLIVASPAAAGCGFLGQFACPPNRPTLPVRNLDPWLPDTSLER